MQIYINQNTAQDFKIWAWGCSHLKTDLSHSENNIEDALAQISSYGFDFDFSINTGDFDGNQTFPTLVAPFPAEGADIVTEFDTQTGFRDKLYLISGNHDCGDAEMDWFLRYLDPKRENTSFSNADINAFLYTPTYMNGTDWHSYYIEFGRNLILFISDRNDLPFPYGRGGSVITGGHPSGSITLETWNWMKSTILANTDKNIFVVTHMNPRNTTIGSPDGDGVCGNFHGTSGISDGSGSLYSIYDEDLMSADSPTDAILDFLRDNTHSVVAWFATHTHTFLDEFYNSRGVRYDIHGVSFINIGHLNRWHNNTGRRPMESGSKFITISNNNIKIEHFIHVLTNGTPSGTIHTPLEYNIPLKV